MWKNNHKVGIIFFFLKKRKRFNNYDLWLFVRCIEFQLKSVLYDWLPLYVFNSFRFMCFSKSSQTIMTLFFTTSPKSVRTAPKFCIKSIDMDCVLHAIAWICSIFWNGFNDLHGHLHGNVERTIKWQLFMYALFLVDFILNGIYVGSMAEWVEILMKWTKGQFLKSASISIHR